MEPMSNRAIVRLGKVLKALGCRFIFYHYFETKEWIPDDISLSWNRKMVHSKLCYKCAGVDQS